MSRLQRKVMELADAATHPRERAALAAGMTEAQMRAVVAASVKQLGSMREAARQWGVSPAYLSDCLNGRRAPGPAVLTPLGYERVVSVVYRKAADPDHCPLCGGTEHAEPLPGTTGRRCVRCCDVKVGE